MEHYITKIYIEELRHLKDIEINLSKESRQHLLITGKNGSGKTTLLLALKKYLMAINEGSLTKLKQLYLEQLNYWQAKLNESDSIENRENISIYKEQLNRYRDGIDVDFSGEDEVELLYEDGNFITAYYPANRLTNVEKGNGVEDIELSNAYSINEEPGKLLHKYMVHLKTQQAYANTEHDAETEQLIKQWFERFENALKELLDDESITLTYNYKQYDFAINQEGRESFDFNSLSDGYSSVLYIVSDLILRMDQNWLLGKGLSNYDMEGIVLIDELETHLHIDLQKKILPFLTKFFPRIQFIVTTHSPYILGSVENVVAYDLEHKMMLEKTGDYSAESLAEGYFDVDSYSETLKRDAKRYLELREIGNPTDEQRVERAKLRMKLKTSSQDLAKEILMDEDIFGGHKE